MQKEGLEKTSLGKIVALIGNLLEKVHICRTFYVHVHLVLFFFYKTQCQTSVQAEIVNVLQECLALQKAEPISG